MPKPVIKCPLCDHEQTTFTDQDFGVILVKSVRELSSIAVDTAFENLLIKLNNINAGELTPDESKIINVIRHFAKNVEVRCHESDQRLDNTDEDDK